MRKMPLVLSKYLKVLFVIAVVVAGGWLRLRAVEMLPIDYDEDDYLRAAQLMAVEIKTGNWAGLMETNYRTEHPPLSKMAYAFAIAALPDAPLVADRSTTASPAEELPSPHFERARTVSAVLGTLEVLLVGLLNPLAGLFLGIHTFTIKYTSQVMLEALPALTSALAVVSYARSKKGNVLPNRYGWLILSALFLGLTASAKYLYCVVGVAIVLDWLLGIRKTRNHQQLLFLAGWGFAAVLFFFASNPYLWPAPIERLRESVFFHGGYATGAAEVQQASFPFWQPFVWLFGSVPWHPGVFVFSLDLLVTGFAVVGFRRLWQAERIYALWVVVSLGFLLVWPTKWPQYILAFTFPWSLAAAAGFKEVVWQPIVTRCEKRMEAPIAARQPAAYSNLRQVSFWLLPGVLVILLITFYPLIFQSVMSFTDFSGRSLRDGLNGGIWRAFFQGITFQAEPVDVYFSMFSPIQEVRYVGLNMLLNIFAYTPDLLFFDLMWTVLVIALQLVMGCGIALLLHQAGLKFKQFWMVVMILPWAIPEFVGALSWLQVLHPHNGWFALSGQSFGEIPGNPFAAALATWENSPAMTLLVLLTVGVWMGFPVIMLAATAGLKLIPKEVYDAAAIDGASGWALFRQITWPMLLPLLAPVIILRAIFAFNQFYLFYVFNPPGGTVTLSVVSYYLVDELNFYSASAAMNVFSVVILIILLGLFNRYSRAGEGVQYV